ncbi:MAG: 23S rRNA (pseudouridine(1915)-N(3))-methyltransferase RlmH [Pseudomonadota bacterium]
MRLRLLAAGTGLPAWMKAGYEDYARRMPRECRTELVEIALGHRGKGADTARATRQEGERMLAALRPGERVVALEVGGKLHSTEALARTLDGWMASGVDAALLIGGPDGLSEACRSRADEQWSLSRLTLPHGLVRVIVAEALYRAAMVLRGHPYHK